MLLKRSLATFFLIIAITALVGLGFRLALAQFTEPSTAPPGDNPLPIWVSLPNGNIYHTTGGNVGIGTTSPTQGKLVVQGDSSNGVYGRGGGIGAGVVGYNSNNCPSCYGVQGFSNSSNIGVLGQSDSGYGVYGVSTSSYAVYGYGYNSVGVYGRSVNGFDFYGAGPKTYFGGNVGIGTTSPAASIPLTLARAVGSASYAPFLESRATDGSTWRMLNGGGLVGIGSFAIRDETNAATRLIITNTGNVRVQGDFTTRGLQKINTSVATAYDFNIKRYVIEATPALVGTVLPIPSAITDELCRDKDGCEVTIAMVNWDASGKPGGVASRSERLFISETGRHWRFANNDVEGTDGNGSTQEWGVWDCYFTDAETKSAGANNRWDGTSGTGFGLLNVQGGGYSDTTTTCRVSIDD